MSLEIECPPGPKFAFLQHQSRESGWISTSLAGRRPDGRTGSQPGRSGTIPSSGSQASTDGEGIPIARPSLAVSLIKPDRIIDPRGRQPNEITDGERMARPTAVDQHVESGFGVDIGKFGVLRGVKCMQIGEMGKAIGLVVSSLKPLQPRQDSPLQSKRR